MSSSTNHGECKTCDRPKSSLSSSAHIPPAFESLKREAQQKRHHETGHRSRLSTGMVYQGSSHSTGTLQHHKPQPHHHSQSYSHKQQQHQHHTEMSDFERQPLKATRVHETGDTPSEVQTLRSLVLSGTTTSTRREGKEEERETKEKKKNEEEEEEEEEDLTIGPVSHHVYKRGTERQVDLYATENKHSTRAPPSHTHHHHQTRETHVRGTSSITGSNGGTGEVRVSRTTIATTESLPEMTGNEGKKKKEKTVETGKGTASFTHRELATPTTTTHHKPREWCSKCNRKDCRGECESSSSSSSSSSGTRKPHCDCGDSRCQGNCRTRKSNCDCGRPDCRGDCRHTKSGGSTYSGDGGTHGGGCTRKECRGECGRSECTHKKKKKDSACRCGSPHCRGECGRAHACPGCNRTHCRGQCGWVYSGCGCGDSRCNGRCGWEDKKKKKKDKCNKEECRDGCKCDSGSRNDRHGKCDGGDSCSKEKDKCGCGGGGCGDGSCGKKKSSCDSKNACGCGKIDCGPKCRSGGCLDCKTCGQVKQKCQCHRKLPLCAGTLVPLVPCDFEDAARYQELKIRSDLLLLQETLPNGGIVPLPPQPNREGITEGSVVRVTPTLAVAETERARVCDQNYTDALNPLQLRQFLNGEVVTVFPRDIVNWRINPVGRFSQNVSIPRELRIDILGRDLETGAYRLLARPANIFASQRALRLLRALDLSLWKLKGLLPLPFASSEFGFIYQFCASKHVEWWIRIRRSRRAELFPGNPRYALTFFTYIDTLQILALFRRALRCTFVCRPIGLCYFPSQARRNLFRCWAPILQRVPDSEATYAYIQRIQGNPRASLAVIPPAFIGPVFAFPSDDARQAAIDLIYAKARAVATCLRTRQIEVDFDAPDAIVVDCRGDVWICAIRPVSEGWRLLRLDRYLAVVDAYVEFGPTLGVRGPYAGDFHDWRDDFPLVDRTNDILIDERLDVFETSPVEAILDPGGDSDDLLLSSNGVSSTTALLGTDLINGNNGSNGLLTRTTLSSSSVNGGIGGFGGGGGNVGLL